MKDYPNDCIICQYKEGATSCQKHGIIPHRDYLPFSCDDFKEEKKKKKRRRNENM